MSRRARSQLELGHSARRGKQVNRAVATGLAGNTSTIVLSGLKAAKRLSCRRQAPRAQAPPTLLQDQQPPRRRRSRGSGRVGGGLPAAAGSQRGAPDAFWRRTYRRDRHPDVNARSHWSTSAATAVAQPPGWAPPAPVIRVDDVSKIYELGHIQVRALRDVSLRIDARRLRGDHGQLGQRQEHADEYPRLPRYTQSGRYLIDGGDVRSMDEDDLSDLRNRKIGFVFQSFNLVARTSALANVELPLAYAGFARSAPKARAQARSRGGDGQPYAPPAIGALGGQQQRVAVARAIVTNPALILADEPTGNLDSTATEDVLRIFARLNEEGRTVVLITHEPDVAEQAKRMIRLSDGQVVEDRRWPSVTAPPPRPR